MRGACKRGTTLWPALAWGISDTYTLQPYRVQLPSCGDQGQDRQVTPTKLARRSLMYSKTRK